MNKINVFVASGNELLEERKETIHIIHELRKTFPNLNLEAVQFQERQDTPFSFFVK